MPLKRKFWEGSDKVMIREPEDLPLRRSSETGISLVDRNAFPSSDLMTFVAHFFCRWCEVLVVVAGICRHKFRWEKSFERSIPL